VVLELRRPVAYGEWIEPRGDERRHSPCPIFCPGPGSGSHVNAAPGATC
jgi:hypothetical protein